MTEYLPIAYYSKQLDEHQQNYKIYNKELLTIVCMLKEYCQLLEGYPLPIEIWSDHKNLTYFKNSYDFTR